MLLQHNLDRNLETYNTKAPFRYQCQLELPNGSLPSQSIRAAVVYCDEDVVSPVRISSLSVDPVNAQCCKVEFMDSAGLQLGFAYLYKSIPSDYITTFILDQYDCIKGHVNYNVQAADAMLQAAIMSGGTYRTGDNDFMLLPQCHLSMMRGIMRAIRVNDELTHKTVYFNPTIEMHTEEITASVNVGLADTSYVLSMAEPLEEGTTLETNPTFNGLTWLSVNNLDSINMVHESNPDYAIVNPFLLSGVHLVIRSADTSNVRVISTDRYTTFTGVRDV